jgi:hypothetical protein
MCVPVDALATTVLAWEGGLAQDGAEESERRDVL